MLRLLAFVAIAGVAVYGLVWLAAYLRNRATAQKPRTLAPDDDPQFLAELDQKLRRQRREEAERQRQETEQPRRNKSEETSPESDGGATSEPPHDGEDEGPEARAT